MKAPRLLLVALVAMSLALIAPGCGDDDDDGETVTVEQTVTSDAGTTTDAVGTPTDTTTPAGDTGPGQFSTPSSNIGCFIDASGARCDIVERTWKPTPEPASCKQAGGDYGQGITVDATHSEFVCAGDTVLGASEILAYGDSAVRGDFVCESAEDGVTCSHTGNGHGFFISRQSFRIF